MYVFVPLQVGSALINGADGVSVLPHTSFTTGSVVGATAADGHSTVFDVDTGPPTSVGAVVLTTLIVAGDSMQPTIILAAPAGVAPQIAAVTYRVFIL